MDGLHRPTNKTALPITRVRAGKVTHNPDQVVTEEPLEIRLTFAGNEAPYKLAITMRTPGADFELAAGFLFSEGLIHSRDDIATITYCVDRELDEAQRYNVVNVTLRSPLRQPDLRTLERHFMVSSACGVCGKASIDALERDGLQPVKEGLRVTAALIGHLSAELRQAQRLFDSTGGLHAAALFNTRGELVAVREDVGRHNALDKLVGWSLMQGSTTLSDHIILVSGRASFELVQKALSLGIPIFCAISAPSSLAVQVARRFNMTLIGFLRDSDFNIYCGQQRIILPHS